MIRPFRLVLPSAIALIAAAPLWAHAQYSTMVPLPPMQPSYAQYFGVNSYATPSWQYSYVENTPISVQGDLNYYRDQIQKLNAQLGQMQSNYGATGYPYGAIGYPGFGYSAAYYPAAQPSWSSPAYTAPSSGTGSASYPGSRYQPPRPSGPAILDQDGGIFQGGGWFFYLTGHGFAPYEQVIIREDGNQVRTVQADAGGNIRPGGIPLSLGRHFFTATGQSSGAGASATVYGAQDVTNP